MNDNQETRAPRNRTLRVSDTEAETLRPLISSLDILASGFRDDMIVNADLFDCLDLIPDGYFDLIIIDPPYNLNKDFNGRKFNAMKADDYDAFLRSWFYKVCDKLSDCGSLYMCGDWKCSSAMQRVVSERLSVINRISWQREKGRGASANWKNGMEDIWFAVKNPKRYFFNVDAVKMRRRVLAPYRSGGKPKDWEETSEGNFRLTYPSNFWDDISIPFWSMPENTDHPTQKPEKLIAKLILASSRPGDKVFDPFLGSGTTAVVARKLGRRFFGVEINSEYCLWAAKRLALAASEPTIQGYADGVFWERNTLNEQRRQHDLAPSSRRKTAQPGLFE